MTREKLNGRSIRYRNLIVLFATTAIAVKLLISPEVAAFIDSLGPLGYAGVLVAGAFFTYMFTTPIATAALFMLSGNLDPLLVGLIGGAGAMVSDLIILKLVRRSISLFDGDIRRMRKFANDHNPVRMNKKNHLWGRVKKYLTFVLAGFIIASPLPDEIGVAMLGASNIKTWKFMAFSFAFNSLGIFLIAMAAKAF
ncbi:MAG: hypothetical protein V1731_00035 [Candidatus Aenigmatarchaeota archaeon]